MANASTSTPFPQYEAGGAWSTTLALVVLPLLLALFVKATWQPSFPKGAPQLVSEARWPILGTWELYRKRKDFFVAAATKSPTGNFSTYFGKHPIVGISGPEARRTFFDSKELSMGEG